MDIAGNNLAIAELTAIKRLLILQLLQSGMKQAHIAAMLGVSEATMSGMLPKGLSATLKKDRVGNV